MRALLIAFLSCAIPLADAMPTDTGSGGPVDTGEESDADADADADTDTDSDADNNAGSGSGSGNNGSGFQAPEDNDGIKTTGAPSLSGDSSGCGGGAAFVVAPLMLLGLRRRQ